MNGNTCVNNILHILLRYKVPAINIVGDRLSYVKGTHVIKLGVVGFRHCKTMAGLRCSSQDQHKNLPFLFKLNLDSPLNTTLCH